MYVQPSRKTSFTFGMMYDDFLAAKSESCQVSYGLTPFTASILLLSWGLVDTLGVVFLRWLASFNLPVLQVARVFMAPWPAFKWKGTGIKLADGFYVSFLFLLEVSMPGITNTAPRRMFIPGQGRSDDFIRIIVLRCKLAASFRRASRKTRPWHLPVRVDLFLRFGWNEFPGRR